MHSFFAASPHSQLFIRWFRADDMHVSEVSAHTALHQHAYILFYQRVRQSAPSAGQHLTHTFAAPPQVESVDAPRLLTRALPHTMRQMLKRNLNSSSARGAGGSVCSDIAATETEICELRTKRRRAEWHSGDLQQSNFYSVSLSKHTGLSEVAVSAPPPVETVEPPATSSVASSNSLSGRKRKAESDADHAAEESGADSVQQRGVQLFAQGISTAFRAAKRAFRRLVGLRKEKRRGGEQEIAGSDETDGDSSSSASSDLILDPPHTIDSDSDQPQPVNSVAEHEKEEEEEEVEFALSPAGVKFSLRMHSEDSYEDAASSAPCEGVFAEGDSRFYLGTEEKQAGRHSRHDALASKHAGESNRPGSSVASVRRAIEEFHSSSSSADSPPRSSTKRGASASYYHSRNNTPFMNRQSASSSALLVPSSPFLQYYQTQQATPLRATDQLGSRSARKPIVTQLRPERQVSGSAAKAQQTLERSALRIASLPRDIPVWQQQLNYLRQSQDSAATAISDAGGALGEALSAAAESAPIQVSTWFPFLRV